MTMPHHNMVCLACGKKGHVVRNCHNKVERAQPPSAWHHHHGAKKAVSSTSTTTKLNETSLLAPSYVPHHLRQIHYLPVTAVMQAILPLNMMEQEQRIFHGLVAPLPYCACDKTVHELPWMTVPQVPIEYTFIYSPRAHQRQLGDFQLTFRNIETAKGRDEYVDIFQGLLREEYEATMLYYERYSQYDIPLVSPNASASASSSEEGEEEEEEAADPGINKNVIQLIIRGIHNAKPSLQNGDVVLIRPHKPLVLRGRHSKSGRARAKFLDGLGHPERVEIQARVVRTIRGTYGADDRVNDTEGAEDRVVVTGLPVNQWKLMKEQHRWHCAVRFLPSTTMYERCLTALRWLTTIPPAMGRDLLFPADIPKLPSKIELPDISPEGLNEQQASFVTMILRRTLHPSLDQVRPPMILTGPAGTGKTKALLVSILQTLKLSEQNRILVCTPSHTAADVVTRRLAKRLTRSQLFRLYDSTRPLEFVSGDMLPFTRQQEGESQFTLPATVEELLAFKVIVCTCSDAHILYLSGLTNASLRSRRQCLQALLVTSLQASPGMQLTGELQGVQQPHFTHLFIDEAAQATEPETLIPFSVVVDDEPGVPKVEIALIGDPRQLSPDNCCSPWAMDGLQKSLLERLLRLPQVGGGRRHLLGPPTKDSWRTMDELIEYSFQKEESSQQDDVVSVFLTLSYRGHPSFLLMPSKLFYFDKLRSIYKEKGGFIDDNDALNNWCRILRKVESLSDSVDQNNPDVVKQTSWPIHFRGVIGKDTSVAVESFWGSNSWSNLEEAKAVLEIVQQLCLKEGVLTKSVGVMAAFRAQVVLIRQLLREHNLGSVNVGMVEDYQAVERHVIVLSLTRSNQVFLAKDVERRAGLFRQPKRINVALTRAEHLLIVIGNPVTMGNDPVWKEWLLFCYQNGLWYGEQGDMDLPSNIKNPENIDARLREKGTQQYKAALLQNGSK